jgi:hypothetical protein
MNGTVVNVAGNGTDGFKNGPAQSAQFYEPYSVLFIFTLVNTKDGTIYVANSSNNVIRAISRSGNVTTFSGSGIAGSLAGFGTNPRFSFPTDFSLGQDGAMYVADYITSLIRRIRPGGMVTKYAGSIEDYQNGLSDSANYGSLSPDAYVSEIINLAIRRIKASMQFIYLFWCRKMS